MRYLFFFFICFCTCCTSSNEWVYENAYYRLTLDKRTGSIVSILKGEQNLVDAAGCSESLFTLKLRSKAESGQLYEYPAQAATRIRLTSVQDTVYISYSGFEGVELEALVKVAVSASSPFIYWNIAVDNRTPYTLEGIDFPNVVVKNDLIDAGGQGRLFWPGMDGCLVENLRVRQEGWWSNNPLDYPYMYWGGYYPAATPMQYMAHYDDRGGLYVAAHDEQGTPKVIEFYPVGDDAIRLYFTVLTSGKKGKYQMPYNMVMGVFDGDWYDASRIYRDWHESSAMHLPPGKADNTALPAWYTESPVVVTYPVRGTKDLGDMTPNRLYPYTSALKYIEKYQAAFGTNIMALLMHWEGSAPWAPPYVWPPYGGTSNYLKFADALHAKNNLIGLYASGTGYTLRSNTDTTFNRYEEYGKKELHAIMKQSPEGSIFTAAMCSGPDGQRIGHDMCPKNAFAGDVVVDQIAQILASPTDYIQYFDQNLGGNCYACYGTEHGHSYGPGLWQNEAMLDIYRRIMPILEKAPQKPLIGCEGAAAEVFIPYLLFNDDRANLNLFIGTPVPAYAFVYHEYIHNFMGNQVATSSAIDMDQSPKNLLQRLAYSFCAGDLLTVVMRDDGQIIWDWTCPWDSPVPDQQETVELIKNLMSWRKNTAKDFLVYGKMQKPLSFSGATDLPMLTKQSGLPIHFSSVFTSNWELSDGTHGQIFVNYLPEEQEITIRTGHLKQARMHNDASDRTGKEISGDITIRIAPLNAVMITYPL